MFLPPSRAKIKMTTDRDIKDRILNVISIFFSNVLRLLFFFLRPRQLTRWRHWKKSQSDEQLLCLLSIAQHSKLKSRNLLQGYGTSGRTFRINVELLRAPVSQTNWCEKTPFWKHSTISQFFGIDDYVTYLFFLISSKSPFTVLSVQIDFCYLSHHVHTLRPRTTDAQRGNSLHCTAENSIPIPNF